MQETLGEPTYAASTLVGLSASACARTARCHTADQRGHGAQRVIEFSRPYGPLVRLGVLRATPRDWTHGGPSRPNQPWRPHAPDGPRGPNGRYDAPSDPAEGSEGARTAACLYSAQLYCSNLSLRSRRRALVASFEIALLRDGRLRSAIGGSFDFNASSARTTK